MITINKPEIKETTSGVRLQAEFDVNDTRQVLWYEVPNEYGKYLTTERADAFVVGLLWFGIKTGHDIRVTSPMSARLHYTLNKHVIPVLSTFKKSYKKIKVMCDQLKTEPLSTANAVGTGLSCGVDSFSTICDHSENSELSHYEITHFTFFNVGSLAHTEKENKISKNIVKSAKSCATELGKEFFIVNSNLNDFLNIQFGASHTLRSISAVLALQKLFKTYYYSSGVPINYFRLYRLDMAYYDIFTLSMLSTESLSLFSTCPAMNRVHKTKMISTFEPSYKYLHVCQYDYPNCGKCFKCLRTLLTLEIIGAIDKYKHLFNMEAYYNKRDNYIQEVISKQSKDLLLREIYNEMIRTNFKP